ncbi:MAG: hypothetical protein GXP31_02945 [Kiritimatiellaeota bacterium]|nr:hypothetical protein [Kiritimatiellota bacterium]
MYFCRKKSKSGRGGLQLLASYRPKGASSPRHRVMLSLGDADIPDEWLRELAVMMTTRLTGNELLLAPELPPEALEWAGRIVHAVEGRRAEQRSETSKRTQPFPRLRRKSGNALHPPGTPVPRE